MKRNKYISFLKKHWWKIVLILLLIEAVDVLHYLKWPKSIAELQFNWKNRRDWRLIFAYWDRKEKDTTKDPQYALANEYFDYYLRERPSTLSIEALKQAFLMWGNLKGTSAIVDSALSRMIENDNYPDILNGITSSYSRDGRFGKNFTEFDLYLRILKKGVGPKTEHFLKFKKAEYYLEKGDYELALAGFRDIVERNNSEYYVKHAAGYIYEIQNLKIGMRAPVFEGTDLNDQKIGLTKNSNKIRLLFFWATTCGPCHGEFPHLKKIAEEFQEQVQIIGIAGDHNKSDLRTLIRKDNLIWPNIFEGEAFFGEVSKKYNILRYPTIYLIDQNGLIAAKDLRGEDIAKRIKSML